MERASLEVYERLPLTFRNRLFFGAPFFQWLALLEESENWDRERIAAFQFERMKNLLEHSMKNVPYYRKLFSLIDFDPGRMSTPDDLRLVPPLDKRTVRDNPVDFIDERIPYRSLIRRPTSGSTGIPLTIYGSGENRAAFHAFRANLLGRIGHTPRSREVSFWSMITLGGKERLPFLRYGDKLALSIRHLSDEWLPRFYEMLRKLDPEYLSGYPSALLVFSSFVRKNNLPHPANLRAVISYAETLYDWQRRKVEEALGTRVFSMYGAAEQVAIGAECEFSSHLHFHPLYGLVELEDTASGHKEIIATGFTNPAMPLIRYRTGDLVGEYTDSCPQCKRNHGTFRVIEGRIQDFLVGKNGQIIPRLMLWTKIFVNTLQYQFCQEEPGRACLRIVRAETYKESDTADIKAKLAEMLGPLKNIIDVEIEFVGEIPRGPSGKYRLVDQRLDMRSFL